MSTIKNPTLRYTALRFGVFAACCVVVATLAYVGVLPEGIGTSNPLWIVALSMLLSAPISYVLLGRQRDEMSQRIVEGVDRAKERLNANRAMEDGLDEPAGGQARDGAREATKSAKSPEAAKSAKAEKTAKAAKSGGSAKPGGAAKPAAAAKAAAADERAEGAATAGSEAGEVTEEREADAAHK